MNDYLKQRWLAKLEGSKPNPVKRAEKKAIGIFFKDQIAKAPDTCENCSISLAGTKAINPAAIVAHILKKSRVKSIATDPHNILYLCGSCHDAFDNGGEEKVKKMAIFKTARARVKELLALIPDSERRFIPDYFLSKKNDK